MKAKLISVVAGVLLASIQAMAAAFNMDYRPPAGSANGVASVSGEEGVAVAKSAAAESLDVGVLRRVELPALESPRLSTPLAVGDVLTLTLFEDSEAVLTLVEKTPSQTATFLAKTEGSDGILNAVVVQDGDSLQVSIQDYLSGLVYTVFASPMKTVISECAPDKTPRTCGGTLEAPRASFGTTAATIKDSYVVSKSEVTGDATTTVDILVVYDTLAADWAKANGGGIDNFAEVSVQKMNAVLANTGLDFHFRFRLVGTYETGGSAGGSLNYALQAAQSGTMKLNGVLWDGVKNKREEVEADIVCVLIDNYSDTGTTGLGYSLQSDSIGFEEYAYNACLIRAVAQNQTMMHEVGHNMGAGHSDAMSDASNCGPQYHSYSSGYYFYIGSTGYHTIMAYNADGYGNYYTSIPYFSSPNHTFKAVPVGDSSHNNSFTLRQTFTEVAAFRGGVESPELGIGTETEDYVWETSARMPWTCVTDDTVDGVDSVRSCEMTGSSTSWMRTTVVGPAELSFYYMMRTYGGIFTVKCDDTTLFERSGEAISSMGWVPKSLSVPSGRHVISFAYTHPSAGYTTGWGNGVRIDRISFDGGEPWCPTYQIKLHRNDASDEKIETYEFDKGVSQRIPSLNSLNWARRGFIFLGWAKTLAEAAAGNVWKTDWALVKDAAAEGETLDVYAVWTLKSNAYAIQFIRNDGAGTWRTVGFTHGEKTRMPSLTNGLGWARRGYEFKGWELTTANANDNTRVSAWKGDWAYVASPTEPGKTLLVYARWALKPGYYQIRFNKNDGTGKWRSLGFQCGVSTKLSTISALGWERDGYKFVGWASNASNAALGNVWKNDGVWVKNATSDGKTLSIYAIWEKE